MTPLQLGMRPKTGPISMLSGDGPRPANATPIKVAGIYGWNVLVQGRHGAFLANPKDAYVGRSLIFYGEYSEGEVEIFAELVKPGDTVLEVGSNIGAHTVPLAQMAGAEGAVYAVEAQRLAYQTLCGNVALNALASVKAFHAAAGAEAGMIGVPMLDPWRDQNFGGLELGAEDASFEAVPVVKIDDWLLQDLALLKVDVEGMELDVLRGARSTIERVRPALYVEADREMKSRELLAFIEQLGYRMWWHFPKLWNPDNFLKQPRNVFGETISINVLCLHRDHAAQGEQLLPGAEIASPDEVWSVGARRIIGK